jgi:hypothetical protein
MNIYQKILLGTFCSLFALGTYSQELVSISGRVVNSDTGEGVAFVNIGIEGTLSGTASDVDGNFVLKIPQIYQSKNLIFSAVGFEVYSIPLEKYQEMESDLVKLKSQTYGIGDVEVSTKSLVLHRILTDVTKSIQQNYPTTPFHYKALYADSRSSAAQTERKRNAVVIVSDAVGYGNALNAYTAVNYRFESVNRNFDVKTLRDGTTKLDDLLLFDIVRTSANILNPAYRNEFVMELIADTDSVWIISYSLTNPEFNRVGHYYAKAYSGNVIIDKKTNAILKNEISMKSKSEGIDGIATAAKPNEVEIDYHIVTTYKKWNGKMGLDSLVIKQTTENSGESVQKTLSQLKVLSMEIQNPKRLTSRQYYENLPSDANFWVTNPQLE